ncbi:hypothetical protein GW17_00040081 [Ensete ventricosum]|nr:hypothetical protein GW17_00040081 [Ensete ventricosum]RZS01545.1 hypothetical protein BHM03_00031412 [Ensete ventricosum]
MARPSTKGASHGQPPCRGNRPRPGHLQGGSRLRPGPLQGAATRRRAACGQPYRQQGRRRRPQEWPPLGRVTVGGQG